MDEINPIYTSRNRAAQNTDELYYKYNILYGSNTNKMIRTYSPTMRPVSSSIKSFSQTLIVKKSDYCRTFTEDEVDLLLQSKTKDLCVEYRDEIRDTFNDYCRKKCNNRKVNFTDCYVGFNFISSLSNILYSTDKIAYLDLAQNNLGDIGVQILCDAIQSSISLVMLNVTSNGISHKGGDSIFKMLIDQKSIISMNLSSIEGINRNRICAVGMKNIVQALKCNGFIEDLNLGGNSIKNEGLKLIAEGMNINNHLHNINISNNELTSIGIQTCFDQIKSSKIIELNISSNPIKNEGLMKIAGCLGNFSLIRKLNVSNCGIDFKGFYDLIINLQNIKRLESLDISENDLNTNRFSSIKSFFQQCGIKSLNMSKCNLANNSGYALGQCLCVNDSIRKIELKGNKITDKGFRSFIPLPKVNSTIESFDISKNYISDITAIEFILNLANNKSIKHINMYDNQLKNESAISIIDVLMKNKIIISINFVFNRIQLKLLEEINRRVYDNVKRNKRQLVPNIIEGIKTLRFKPEELNYMKEKIYNEEKTSKMLEMKLEEDTALFNQRKKEDKHRHEILIHENEEIQKRIRVLDEILIKLIQDIKINKNDIIKKKDKLKKEIDNIAEEILNQKKNNDEVNREINEIYLGYEYEYGQLNQKFKLSKEKANLSEISLKSIKNDLNSKYDKLAELDRKITQSQLSMSRRQSRSGLSSKGLNNVGSPTRRKSLMMNQKSPSKMSKRESILKVYSLSPDDDLREDNKINSKNKSKKNIKKKTKAKSKSKGQKTVIQQNEKEKDSIIKLLNPVDLEKNETRANLSTIKRNLKPNRPNIPVLKVKPAIHMTNESSKQTESNTNVLPTFHTGAGK